MIRFRTFIPYWKESSRGRCYIDPTLQLNDWLKENPNVEVIEWKAYGVGTSTDYNITIQYKKQKMNITEELKKELGNAIAA